MLCAALPPAVGQRQHRDGEALGARRSSEPSAGPDADAHGRYVHGRENYWNWMRREDYEGQVVLGRTITP